MNKKGFALSVNYLVVAILALIVLVAISVYFTGGVKYLFGQQKKIIETSADTKTIWRNSCELWCAVESVEWRKHKFGDEELDCKGLGVDCPVLEESSNPRRAPSDSEEGGSK